MSSNTMTWLPCVLLLADCLCRNSVSMSAKEGRGASSSTHRESIRQLSMEPATYTPLHLHPPTHTRASAGPGRVDVPEPLTRAAQSTARQQPLLSSGIFVRVAARVAFRRAARRRRRAAARGGEARWRARAVARRRPRAFRSTRARAPGDRARDTYSRNFLPLHLSRPFPQRAGMN
jgi:hypothetical protein